MDSDGFVFRNNYKTPWIENKKGVDKIWKTSLSTPVCAPLQERGTEETYAVSVVQEEFPDISSKLAAMC
jgi:hypothetical protein